jgi:hypothetical protein
MERVDRLHTQVEAVLRQQQFPTARQDVVEFSDRHPHETLIDVLADRGRFVQRSMCRPFELMGGRANRR